MNEYIIFTDSCCDVSSELLAQRVVPYANMTIERKYERQGYHL